MSEVKQDVTESLTSGEYYRDALRWYGTMYHSPISERALLIIITGIALLITIMTMIGLFMLLPLQETKPMIVRLSDSLEKVARVEQMMEHPRDDADAAVMHWFVSDFIKAREEYNIDRQQAHFKRVYTLSAAEVYQGYVSLYRSPSSPTVRYERHTKRHVDVDNIRVVEETVLEKATGGGGEVVETTVQVRFIATEETPTEHRRSVWQADMTFRLSKIYVDQITGAITPMDFRVIRYESKQLGLE